MKLSSRLCSNLCLIGLCLLALSACRSTKDIALSLEENPTTGYRWVLEEGDYELVDERYQQNKAAEGMVGVGGVHTFYIKPESQECVITAYYKRSWESGYDQKRTFIIRNGVLSDTQKQ